MVLEVSKGDHPTTDGPLPTYTEDVPPCIYANWRNPLEVVTCDKINPPTCRKLIKDYFKLRTQPSLF